MAVKKMSVNVAKASKKSRLPVSSLLPRFAIYSALVAGIMASSYDFQLNTIVRPLSWLQAKEFYQFYPEAIKYILSINRAQKAYYFDFGQFSDSFAKLGLRIKAQTENNNYTIVSSMGPVQTLHNHREPAQFESAIVSVTPTDRNPGKSYTGAVFAYKQKGSNRIITIEAICESDRDNATYAETWNPPTFDGQEIRCQPGTTLWQRN